MMPKTHILVGFIGMIILWLGFDVGWFSCLVFWGSSFLIDIDHYLFYVVKEKDWSPGGAFDLFVLKKGEFEKMSRKERKRVMNAWYFLHGLEWVLVFGLVGFFVWDLFWFVAGGFLLHLVLDWVEVVRKVRRWDKVSCIWDFWKFGRLGKV